METTVYHDEPEISTTPCNYCSRPTKYTGTRMCDNCWELMNRIGADPDSAEKILAEVKAAVKLRKYFTDEKGGDKV